MNTIVRLINEKSLEINRLSINSIKGCSLISKVARGEGEEPISMLLRIKLLVGRVRLISLLIIFRIEAMWKNR